MLLYDLVGLDPTENHTMKVAVRTSERQKPKDHTYEVRCTKGEFKGIRHRFDGTQYPTGGREPTGRDGWVFREYRFGDVPAFLLRDWLRKQITAGAQVPKHTVEYIDQRCKDEPLNIDEIADEILFKLRLK